MGLYMNRNDQRSDLQKRIADDLNAKARAKKKRDDETYPDGVNDSAYIKNSSESPLGVLVVVIAALVLIVSTIVYLFFIN